MTTDTITIPTWTPPLWLNAGMKLMLRTPGLQRFLGRAIALVTFTGRRSGRSYTTPVTYARHGDTVIVITKKFRKWWRNFEERPEVQLRLAGRTFTGRAKASVGDEREASTLMTFLQNRPVDAKAYGVTLDPDGRVSLDEARALLPHVVIIRIALGVPEDRPVTPALKSA